MEKQRGMQHKEEILDKIRDLKPLCKNDEFSYTYEGPKLTMQESDRTVTIKELKAPNLLVPQWTPNLTQFYNRQQKWPNLQLGWQCLDLGWLGTLTERGLDKEKVVLMLKKLEPGSCLLIVYAVFSHPYPPAPLPYLLQASCVIGIVSFPILQEAKRLPPFYFWQPGDVSNLYDHLHCQFTFWFANRPCK